MNRAAIIKSLF